MKIYSIRLVGSIIALCLFGTVKASGPLWTFTPLTATTLSVPANDTAIVQYQVSNQSAKTHTLQMQSIQGVTQLTTGLGVCGNPFILTGKSSCTLSLQVDGSQLTQPITNGPIVCEQNSALQCYRPDASNILQITQADAIIQATITVTRSPLTLTTSGPTGTLNIHNTSSTIVATNISSNFTDTALNGHVEETVNTCHSLAPLSCCTLTYRPGNTVVAQTDFPIQGTNTNIVTAAIQIDAGFALSSVSPSSGSAAGGTGVTLTGTGFSTPLGVVFGGASATSVNVINSTTATAVTPSHPAGTTDVSIISTSGSALKANGYTYVATAIGQSAYGGKIACLNAGNTLIAATTDNSTSIEWGGYGTSTHATSDTAGAINTVEIVTVVGNNGGTPYAAQQCSSYEIDSLGNTPCETGNTCYNDWFLPAGNNSTSAGQLNCLYVNKVAIGGFAAATYWSSTESIATTAFLQNFNNGVNGAAPKSNTLHIRCVRSFTP